MSLEEGDVIYLLSPDKLERFKIEITNNGFGAKVNNGEFTLNKSGVGNIYFNNDISGEEIAFQIDVSDGNVTQVDKGKYIGVTFNVDQKGTNLTGYYLKFGESLVESNNDLTSRPNSFGNDFSNIRIVTGNDYVNGIFNFSSSEPYFVDIHADLSDLGGGTAQAYDPLIAEPIPAPPLKYFVSDTNDAIQVITSTGTQTFNIALNEGPVTFETFEGTYQISRVLVGSSVYEITPLSEPEPEPEPEGPVPCLTNTCNVLTPSGYRNVSKIKQGDFVTTSDNRLVEVQRVLTSTVSTKEIKPRLIKAHQFGKNQPIINTHISDWHAYQEQGMWKLPKKSKLPKEWSEDKVTFYHLELPDYYNDNLVVNGLVMEAWDGKMPQEIREYLWKKVGKKYVRQIL